MITNKDFTKFIKGVFLISLCLYSTACQQKPGNSEPLAAKTEILASKFFDTYAKRTDWQSFLEQYDSNLIFEDKVLQIQFSKLDEFEAFYNWPDTAFQKHEDFPNTLVLEQLICQDSIAVGSGYFTPFYYKEVLYGQDRKLYFSMELHFNQAGKIVQHIDWIAYPKSLIN